MAPAVIAAIISALGGVASSYLNSRNRTPGPLGGTSSGTSFNPVSSSMASEAIKSGTDVAAEYFRMKQKQQEEEERRKREAAQQQQAQNAQNQSVGQMYGSQASTGGLRGALELALRRAMGW